ncbi:MAG: tetratricopeptide repeat protein [Nitrospinales bacterium]
MDRAERRRREKLQKKFGDTPPVFDARSSLQQAASHHRAGRLREAEQLYQQVLAAEPENAEALHSLGILARQIGMPDVALELIKKALAANPGEILYTGNLGNVYKDLGRLEEAETCYRQVLQAMPYSDVAHGNLGIVLQERDKLDEAVACYRRALELNPGYAEAHCCLGGVWRTRNRLREAEDAFRQALKINPNYVDALCNLGVVLQEQGKSEEAEASFRHALQIAPESPVAWFNLGAALQAAGNLDEAIDCYRRARELNPAHPESHNNLGVALQAGGRVDEAIECYRRALEADPDYVESRFNLGLAFKETGRSDEAVSVWRRVLQIDRGHAGACRHLCEELFSAGRLDEAETVAREAADLDPKAAYPWSLLGRISIKRNDPGGAESHFRHCLSLDAADPFAVRLELAALGADIVPDRASDAYILRHYAEQAVNWDKTVATETYHGHNLVLTALEPELRKTSRPAVLDAGCGTGVLGPRLRPSASRLDGVDLSPQMIAAARRKNVYDRLEVEDVVTFMQSNADVYDIVMAAAVLIHFGDLGPAFAAAKTALRKNGLFVFTLFKSSGADVAASDFRCHLHSRAYVAAQAEKSGFRVEAIREAAHEYRDSRPIEGLVVSLRKE